MQCCLSTTYCFNLKIFFLFLWVKKVLNLARIKPLPDTAVICSVNGFYLLTDDTCKSFLLPGAFNKKYISVSQDMVLLEWVLSWHLSALAILVLN